MTIVAGIEYELPKVYLLKDSGIGVSEIAARTCYDSYSQSENPEISDFNAEDFDMDDVSGIEKSELLGKLSWVNFHHSILEHSSLSYLIKGTSRGVLQEHARHRIHSLSVRSTRYTMSSIINAFIAVICESRRGYERSNFRFLIEELNMFVTKDPSYNKIEIDTIFDKLMFQFDTIGKEKFFTLALSKDNRETINNSTAAFDDTYNILQNGKKKKNVGDSFKHVVSDNWKVDIVSTFNLRSLKNYFDLRTSGAAYFQIQWLAGKMKEVTPMKYLSLIDKEFKNV